jgi:hypothetical protein
MVKKYLRRLLKWAMSSDGPEAIAEDAPYTSNSVKSRPASIGEGTNGMNFVVYNAIGGKVIQFTTYDVVRDRGYSNLYIVTDKEDLGEELGQIITKESLSR